MHHTQEQQRVYQYKITAVQWELLAIVLSHEKLMQDVHTPTAKGILNKMRVKYPETLEGPGSGDALRKYKKAVEILKEQGYEPDFSQAVARSFIQKQEDFLARLI